MTQTSGLCCMKPNGPSPVILPKVVAAALASATSVKIVPWIWISRRRNAAAPDDCRSVMVLLVLSNGPAWRQRSKRPDAQDDKILDINHKGRFPEGQRDGRQDHRLGSTKHGTDAEGGGA